MRQEGLSVHDQGCVLAQGEREKAFLSALDKVKGLALNCALVVQRLISA